MKYIIFFALLLSISSANALDVAGFEKLSKEASGPDQLQSRTVESMLKSYFTGIRDMLHNATDGDSGVIYYTKNKKSICLPFGVELDSDVLRSWTIKEIKKARDSGLFGDTLNGLNVTLFTTAALTTNYPCKEI